jgi:hypothetical protein
VFPLSESCHRFGLDPVAVAEKLPESGSLLESLNAIEEMSVTPGKSEPHHIGEVPRGMHKLFGDAIPPILPDELWKERVWLSMILGVCPIFLIRFPQISEFDLYKFLTKNEYDLNILKERIRFILEN